MKIWLTLLCLLSIVPERMMAGPREGALIRDAEVEDIMRSFANPIFKAAKLNPKSMSLYVVNSSEVNAFATSGSIVVFYSGLLMRATSALQVIGVLAHETAHVANHHSMLGMEAYKQAVLQNLLGTLGGIALGAMNPEAGAAILMGSQDMILRGLLKFSRTQEGSADQGAVRYLDSLGWSSDGLLEFLNILHHGDILVACEQHIDPYLMTHPLLTERFDFLKSHIAKSPYTKAAFPQKFEEDFRRLQVKLRAFTDPPLRTLANFPATDQSLLGRYARAIAHLQNAQPEDSLKEIESLLRDYPKDPFFWDLKGQILFESGKIKEAASAYEKAVALRPDIPLLSVTLAHALIESNDLEKAFPLLARATIDEPDNALVHRLLAIYYGKKDKTGLAALSLAEMAFQTGDLKQATQQAKRAMHFLKGDAVNLTRAKDLLDEVERAEKPASGPF